LEATRAWSVGVNHGHAAVAPDSQARTGSSSWAYFPGEILNRSGRGQEQKPTPQVENQTGKKAKKKKAKNWRKKRRKKSSPQEETTQTGPQ